MLKKIYFFLQKELLNLIFSHWYTASRAYKFCLADSAECQCCRKGVEETTAHVFQCPNRNEIHIDHRRKLTELMADQQIPNGPLYLIEAGIDLALISDTTHQGEAWDGDENGNKVEQRVAQLTTDDDISFEYKEAFRQQTIIGWANTFTGKLAKGWRNCWIERQQ